MKKNTYIASVEKLFIDLYNKRELTETILTSILKEMHDCYIDPDQTSGLEAWDGKKFKELICYIMQPLTHMEIMENSRKIDESGGYIWENLQKTEDLFHYLWYCELDMADSEEEAENRPLMPLVVPIE